MSRHRSLHLALILLLVAQTLLVSAGRVDIHRRLGIAGFSLACLMVILGVLAATDSLALESCWTHAEKSAPRTASPPEWAARS